MYCRTPQRIRQDTLREIIMKVDGMAPLDEYVPNSKQVFFFTSMIISGSVRQH